uniref:KRAB-related domain-containing protein n=1 Tax=Pan troglodytes TaxID=9598 RepID=A0A2I3TB40_PANTR
MNGDDAFARRPKAGAQIPEKIQKAFDDIAKYFSKKEWEKMKSSEKISYVYMKRKYEAMTKLGFKATLPPFMRNTGATDLQGNDFDNDRNHRNQVERPQMTFGRLQGIFPKIMPKKPAENNGKQLCPPGKRTTSEKINKASGKRKQFGNNPSDFPGYVQVCGLGVWHGSQTSLGADWAEELTQLQMRCLTGLPEIQTGVVIHIKNHVTWGKSSKFSQFQIPSP